MDSTRVLIWSIVIVIFLSVCFGGAYYYSQNELPPAIELTIGTGAPGDSPTELNEPTGVTVDMSGNIYVLDTRNCKVKRFDGTGKMLDVWGGVGSDDSQFKEALRIEFAPDNTVWVADTGNNRLQHFDSQGGFLAEVGSLGQTEGQFAAPIGMAFDPEGNLWVCDARNNRLQKFTPEGEFLESLESSGTVKFNQPWGLDFDRHGNIIVANTNAHQILKLTPDGELLAKWGLPGDKDGEFKKPTDVLVTFDDHIMVSDTGNNRIQTFTNQGEFVKSWGTVGNNANELLRPQQLCEAAGRLIFIADAGNNRIQMMHQREPLYLFGDKPAPYPSAKHFADGESMLDEVSNDTPAGKADKKKDKDGKNAEGKDTDKKKQEDVKKDGGKNADKDKKPAKADNKKDGKAAKPNAAKDKNGGDKKKIDKQAAVYGPQITRKEGEKKDIQQDQTDKQEIASESGKVPSDGKGGTPADNKNVQTNDKKEIVADKNTSPNQTKIAETPPAGKPTARPKAIKKTKAGTQQVAQKKSTVSGSNEQQDGMSDFSADLVYDEEEDTPSLNNDNGITEF